MVLRSLRKGKIMSSILIGGKTLFFRFAAFVSFLYFTSVWHSDLVLFCGDLQGAVSLVVDKLLNHQTDLRYIDAPSKQAIYLPLTNQRPADVRNQYTRNIPIRLYTSAFIEFAYFAAAWCRQNLQKH